MRILVIRYGFIGDCVMVAHVMSRFRAANPDANIEWMIARGLSPLVAEPNLANHLIKVVRRLSSRSPNPRYQIDKFKAIKRIEQANYDFILNFENHPRYLPSGLNIIQMSKFTGYFDRPEYVSPAELANRYNSPTPHWIDLWTSELGKQFQMDRTAKCIVPETPGKRRLLGLLRDEVAGAARSTSRNRPTSRPIATITVGASRPDKGYPLESWAAVGRALDQKGFLVVYLGGNRDACPKDALGINLVGKTLLDETMAWVKDSAVHLATDTGTGHIAAAYGVPVVSLFGPTDPLLIGPYTDNKVILANRERVADIQPEAVIEAALSICRSG